MAEGLCSCGRDPVLTSPITLYCGVCSRRLMSTQDARDLDDLNLRATSGDAARLPHGRLKEAAAATITSGSPLKEPAGESLISRRKAISLCAGLLGAALGGAFGTHLYYAAGGTAREERVRLRVIGSELLAEQVARVDAAAQRSEDLRALATTYDGDGRYAAARYARALADHIEGTYLHSACEAYEALLKGSHSSAVVASLRFRYAKALAAAGQVEEGLVCSPVC